MIAQPNTIFTLDQAKTGDVLCIRAIDCQRSAVNALRIGLSEGETVELVSKVPAGPLVVRKGRLEIALGREYCKKIQVEKQ